MYIIDTEGILETRDVNAAEHLGAMPLKGWHVPTRKCIINAVALVVITCRCC